MFAHKGAGEEPAMEARAQVLQPRALAAFGKCYQAGNPEDSLSRITVLYLLAGARRSSP